MAEAFYTPIVRLPKSKTGSSSNRSNGSRQGSIQVGTTELKNMLVGDTLYFDGLHGAVSDMDIRAFLQSYPPDEVVIHQDRDSGYLRFSDPKLADRVYSIFNGLSFPNSTSKLEFRLSADGSYEPEPKGPILEVRGLRLKNYNDGLYDLFRPFGPLSICMPIVTARTVQDTGLVRYFYAADSDEALHHLNGKIVEGNTISVAPFTPSKTRDTEQGSKNNSASVAPSIDKPDSGYVDYSNLYIKNLEPHIDNDALYHLFKKFGRIVSARVMSNTATGQSKGYGFVSYDKPDEAAAALQEMNGKTPLNGSKPLIVAFHEPKKPRQEKQQSPQQQHQQQHQHQHQQLPQPQPPHQQQPQHQNQHQHQHQHQQHQQNQQQHQQQHNHHYQHVGTSPVPNGLPHFMNPIGPPVRLPPHSADFSSSSMAPIVPPSSAAVGMGMGYDNRHPYEMNIPTSMPSQVNGLGIDNVDQIALNIKTIGTKRPSPTHQMNRKFSAAESNFGQHPLRPSPTFSTSPMSGVSRTGPLIASLASGINVQPRPSNLPPQQPDYRDSNGRPTLRRKNSLESVSSVMTESSASMQRQRLADAVLRCGDYSKALNDIVDMLLTLKRKERLRCLFSQEFLREKIELALIALETFNEDDPEDDDEDDEDIYGHHMPGVHAALAPPSPPVVRMVPHRASKAIPIVAPPPEPIKSPTAKKSVPITTPTVTTTTITATTSTATAIATTAAPAVGATNGATGAVPNGNSSTTTAIASPGSSNSRNTNSRFDVEALLASLEGKPIHEKKQQLGDHLFPLVKATGTRHAPKVTIRLLDSIDLRVLAHLMYDKEKLKECVEKAFASLK